MRATSRRMGACCCSSGRAPRPAWISGWRIPATCNRPRSWCRRQPTNATRSSREWEVVRLRIERVGRIRNLHAVAIGRGNTRAGFGRGGSQVRWRADWRELFYVANDGTLMAAAVTPGEGAEAPELAAPVPLFAAQVGAAPSAVAGAQYQSCREMASAFSSTSLATTSGRRPSAGFSTGSPGRLRGADRSRLQHARRS